VRETVKPQRKGREEEEEEEERKKKKKKKSICVSSVRSPVLVSLTSE
jgi:flagellar basal body-associated protein FliL